MSFRFHTWSVKRNNSIVFCFNITVCYTAFRGVFLWDTSVCLYVAVINYLLKTSTSCIYTPEEHLAKYEKPFDVCLASGRLANDAYLVNVTYDTIRYCVFNVQ